MSKLFPLTTTGVQELINELYALPQIDLQPEADAIGLDFPLWVKSHFSLSATQIQFLDAIDVRWINNAAIESKYFLENRLPIELYKDQLDRTSESAKDRGKLLDLEKSKKTSYNEEIGFEESETLNYSISYPIL